MKRGTLWIAVIAILASVAAFVFACIWKGTAWLFANVIPDVEMLDIGIAIACVLLIPFSFFRRTRSLSAHGFLSASLVFGTTVWLFLFAISYGYDPLDPAIASVLALFMGALLAGAIGVRKVPGFIATMVFMLVMIIGAGGVKFIVDDKAWGTAEMLGAGLALTFATGVLAAILTPKIKC